MSKIDRLKDKERTFRTRQSQKLAPGNSLSLCAAPTRRDADARERRWKMKVVDEERENTGEREMCDGRVVNSVLRERENLEITVSVEPILVAHTYQSAPNPDPRSLIVTSDRSVAYQLLCPLYRAPQIPGHGASTSRGGIWHLQVRARGHRRQEKLSAQRAKR